MKNEQRPRLLLQTSPRLRKYLGEENDPHFEPESPLICRQTFTEEEEESLKNACTKALANVVTADKDDIDTSLEDLAAYIMTGVSAHGLGQHVDSFTSKILAEGPGDLGSSLPTSRRESHDTGTMSQSSEATAAETCAVTTARTSAVVTPGEAGKGFFDSNSPLHELHPTYIVDPYCEQSKTSNTSMESSYTFFSDESPAPELRMPFSTYHSMDVNQELDMTDFGLNALPSHHSLSAAAGSLNQHDKDLPDLLSYFAVPERPKSSGKPSFFRNRSESAAVRPKTQGHIYKSKTFQFDHTTFTVPESQKPKFSFLTKFRWRRRHPSH